MPLPSALTPQKAFELGLAGIGVTLSVSAGAALSVAKFGTARKVNIRRVYGLHQQLLDTYLASVAYTSLDNTKPLEVARSFKSAAVLSLLQVDDCSTESHIRYEQFRVALFAYTESETIIGDEARHFVERLSIFILYAYGSVSLKSDPIGIGDWLAEQGNVIDGR